MRISDWSSDVCSSDLDADCGGSMVCGTCHVHVADRWLAKLPPKSSMDTEILDYVPEPHPNARLSCQIPVNADTDGIELTIPRMPRCCGRALHRRLDPRRTCRRSHLFPETATPRRDHNETAPMREK